MRIKTILFLFFMAVLAAMCSCNRTEENQKKVSLVGDSVTRAKCLENGTITYVRLTNEQLLTLRATDTVWVDLSKHVIDDTADYTMKCVLYAKVN